MVKAIPPIPDDAEWKEYRKRPVIVRAWLNDTSRTIQTLEGPLDARVGDYIIEGTAKELYPCKPFIFQSIYELIEVDNGDKPAEPLQHALNLDLIQIRNPISGKYVKIDRSKGIIVEHKESDGPYRNIPIV